MSKLNQGLKKKNCGTYFKKKEERKKGTELVCHGNWGAKEPELQICVHMFLAFPGASQSL